MIINFPQSKQIGAPAISGATTLDILSGRIREGLGRVLNFLRVPGRIKNLAVKDELTGQEIEIKVGVLFTRLTVNGRDYFFNRLTGKFDGTGMGCR